MARTSGSFSGITGPKIRSAALRLFAQSGYAAVSMRQIAGEVGLKAGALYNYTPDKQTLLFDLLKVHMEELLSALKDSQSGGTALEQLEAFTRFHISYHHARKDEVFISYMELRNLTESNFAVIESLRRSYEEHVQEILEQGKAEGAYDIQDSKITALAIIAMLGGMNTWYRADGRLSLSEVEEIYWQLVKKLVTGKHP